jgi:hypothetical protein
MSTTGLLITNAGAAAILADLSGGTNLVLSHVAWGDSNGAPYNPVATQTALVREKYRATIASMAVVDGAIVVDAILPADTNDASARPSHSFSVAECGLFSSDGTLIGVARMGNGFKPAPSSGQAVTATYRLKLAVANPSAITVQIDAAQQIHLGRMVRPFFLSIDDVLNAPPGSPTSGATYVIGAAPTGAWTGFAHYLAQWVGVWVLTIAPTGHLVVDQSEAESSASRYLRRTAAGWESASATDVRYGVARAATDAEAASGASVLVFMTPAQGRAMTSSLASIPGRTQVFSSSGTFTVPANVTQVEVICIGGGGGGGASNNSTAGGTVLGNSGAGGGGGGYAYKVVSGLTPGGTVAVTVGVGGTAGANAAGGNGGSSSFGAHCSATGGTGGAFGSSTIGSGGSGGNGSGGDINVAGGTGGSTGTNNTGTPTQSEILNIFNKGGVAAGGFATASFGGTGSPGRGFGCAGSGASGGSGLAGGVGAAGVVIVRW